jgi:hypothetical protein
MKALALAASARERGNCYDFAEFWRFLEGLHATGGCPGCRAGGGFPECQIRNCTRERGLEL